MQIFLHKNVKNFHFFSFLSIFGGFSRKYEEFFKNIWWFENFFVPLQPNYEFGMEEQNPISESQVIILVWRNKGELDGQRFEVFSRMPILYRKYTGEQLGVTQGALNNFFVGKDDNVMYENSLVQIIRTKLQSRKDYPTTEEEKKANKEKVQKRKNKEG